MLKKGLTKVKEKLQLFRENIYSFFHHRKDAAMELIDSLSSNTQASSIVELSLNPHHRRNYCSITRVLDEFYSTKSVFSKQEQNKQLMTLLAEACPPLKDRPYHLFAADCTPNSRIFSHTLQDRSPVHAPNPVLGNKPITIGHQYSIVAYLPEKETLHTPLPPWVIPLACERVRTGEKAILLGIKQIQACLDSPTRFKNELCVSVADCAYSSPDCIVETRNNLNWIHISRLRNNRNLYYSAATVQKKRKKGRPKCYGSALKLKDKRTWKEPTDCVEIQTLNQKGQEQKVKIQCWKKILMRGKKHHHLSDYPLNVIKIEIYKPNGELLFQRALWLVVCGQRRDELSLIEIFKSYRQRFDIEHFFRFGKDRLLLDKSQTPEVDHEEAFWQLAMIAYVQLYLGSELANSIPNPWERHLPNFLADQSKRSPTQVQRDFSRIIRDIGTPAKPPKPRNKSKGRQLGAFQIKRIRQAVILKRKKRSKRQLT